MSDVGHVTRLEHDGKEILLVGTAHVSQRSVDEVRRVIAEERPDTVCVELDAARHKMLVDGSAWRSLDVFQVIKQKRVLFLLSSLALGSYQRKIGEKLGVRPGAELLAAVEAAEAIGAELVLADRDIQATLKRTWANLSFWDRAQITAGLLTAPFEVEEIDEERLEQLKDKDTIGEMLHEVAEQMPRVKAPLIDERDLYLMSKIQSAPGKKIVGVVGAAHVEGMVQKLGQTADYEALSRIPPPSRWVVVMQWLLPLLVVAAFAAGWMRGGDRLLTEMAAAWVIPTSLLSGLFTILALGHPLTILSAVVSAPITTLSPVLGVGMVTGLLEAYLRKPTVEDCENVQQDIGSVRGVYGNRLTRVLLVFVLSTLGAALGAWIGASSVIQLL